MRPESQHLFDVLKCGKTYLSELWNLLSTVMTLAPGTQRDALRLLLDELQNGMHIEFPKSDNLWDKSAIPYLPKWVVKPKSKKQQIYASGIIWSPELSFLASQPVRPDSHWLRVDTWLKKTRGKKNVIKPTRERSLDIFEDEKILDSLITHLPFKLGHITLETLQCYYVPEPIPWLPGPAGSESKLGLCVENSTTYDTLCRFNRESGLWGFVAYGRGNGFASMSDGIVSVVESYNHKRVLYFGDMDLEGVEIAARGARRISKFGITVELDHRLYALLLNSGKEAPSKTGGELSEDAFKLLIEAKLDVLPDMFRRYQRIAQEWLGLEVLRETFNSLLLD